MGLLDNKEESSSGFKFGISEPWLAAAIGLLDAGEQGKSTSSALTRGLLGYATGKHSVNSRKAAKEDRELERQIKQAQLDKLNSPSGRGMYKGADGFNYWLDNPTERVNPNIQTQPNSRKMFTDGSGRKRWKDTLEYVLPDLQMQEGGKFKDTKEMLAAKQATRSAFDKSTAIDGKVLDRYQYAVDLIGKGKSIENFTGADDTLLMKAFANMILPTESVMGDDLAVIAQQEGLPSLWHQYAAQFKGNGQLGVDARRSIYTTMAAMANTAIGKYRDQERRFQFDIDQGGFNPESIFRQSLPSIYEPPILPTKQPEAGSPEAAKKISDEWGY